MNAECHKLSDWFVESRRITLLTGAGISTDSGIPDFRSANGLWSDEELFFSMSAGYLQAHPDLFWPRFKNAFMGPRYRLAKPNSGHRAIALMEELGKDVTVITQNVDGLHQDAGSSRVLEVHGTSRSATCPACQTRYAAEFVLRQEVPRCTTAHGGGLCNVVLWPDVVLFDQAVRQYDEALSAVVRSDLLLVLGTSLEVHPVAQLPNYRPLATKLAIINLDATPLDGVADLVLHDRISRVLSEVLGLA